MKKIYILMDNDGIIAAYTRQFNAERESAFRQGQEAALHKRYGGEIISQKHYFHVVPVTLIEGE